MSAPKGKGENIAMVCIASKTHCVSYHTNHVHNGKLAIL